MNKTLTFFMILLVIVSCNAQNSLQKIEYKTNYKFSDDLEKIRKVDAQTAAFYLSAIGEYKKALEVWDTSIGKETFIGISQLDSLKDILRPENAIDFIIEKSKHTNYTILNEAHHQPIHRVFAKKLLQHLYNKGYRNLAVETLSLDKEHKDTLLNNRKYPKVRSGSYSREPQFGDFIREAMKIGYYVLPYDDQDKYESEREIEQAKNIIKNQKEGKTFVYGGFQHALEGGHTYWGKAMAENLKQLSGKDPLTIDQVIFTERSKDAYNHPFYNRQKLEQSSVFIDQHNESYKIKETGGYYDIAVFYPKTKYIYNRPNWVFVANKTSVKLELQDLDITMPFQVLAFKENEDPRIAVPIDIIQINDKSQPCYLGLAKGNYNIIVVDKANTAYTFYKKIR